MSVTSGMAALTQVPPVHRVGQGVIRKSNAYEIGGLQHSCLSRFQWAFLRSSDKLATVLMKGKSFEPPAPQQNNVPARGPLARGNVNVALWKPNVTKSSEHGSAVLIVQIAKPRKLLSMGRC